MKVAVRRLPHAAGLPLPSYATVGSAGMDLPAAVGDDVVLAPGQIAAVPVGLALALPEGSEAQIRPRSGLALKHGITVLNAPGTIDSDYRGEVKVILINHGAQAFTISRGLKIAQMVVAAHARVEWQEEIPLDATARADRGFGSTGPKVEMQQPIAKK